MLWIFGVIISGLSMIIGAGVGWAFTTSNRITRVETLVSTFSRKAGEILHSPHTPELDALLEKYVKSYQDRHYELTYAEWEDLKRQCDALENDQTLAKGERLLAAMVSSVCEHKLLLPKAK